MTPTEKLAETMMASDGIALIQAAVDDAVASKTALGYDANKLKLLARFVIANWHLVVSALRASTDRAITSPPGSIVHRLRNQECSDTPDLRLEAAAEIERLTKALSGSAGAVAWVIPGDDTADCNGFVAAMAYEHGEFTRPLYARPQSRSEPTIASLPPREEWEPWQEHLFELVYADAVRVTGDQPRSIAIANAALLTASQTSGEPCR
jgi:hypothetical protein